MSVRINNSQARRIAATVRAHESDPNIKVPWKMPRVIERGASSSGTIIAAGLGTLTSSDGYFNFVEITFDPVLSTSNMYVGLVTQATTSLYTSIYSFAAINMTNSGMRVVSISAPVGTVFHWLVTAKTQ